MDWNTNELKISFNGKEYIIILIIMHKVKNKLEVNCSNITPECDDSSILNYISQDLSEDDVTLKKKHMSYEELEKLLYDTLISKGRLIEINKNLRSFSSC